MLRAGQLLAVEPDIGRVVDARKLQPGDLPRFISRDVELGPVPPRTVELSAVDLFEIGAEVEIGVETVGHQRRHWCRRHRGRVPPARFEPRRRKRGTAVGDLGQPPGGPSRRSAVARCSPIPQAHRTRRSTTSGQFQRSDKAKGNASFASLPLVSSTSPHTTSNRVDIRVRYPPPLSIRDRWYWALSSTCCSSACRPCRE